MWGKHCRRTQCFRAPGHRDTEIRCAGHDLGCTNIIIKRGCLAQVKDCEGLDDQGREHTRNNKQEALM